MGTIADSWNIFQLLVVVDRQIYDGLRESRRLEEDIVAGKLCSPKAREVMVVRLTVGINNAKIGDG